jgi:hypothetical protein
MNAAIKPIETVYKGCKFRSRLEARWAVCFDALGLEWEYEKEGYQLPSGWYLPDFWISTWGRWAEIKPKAPTDQEIEMLMDLECATDKDSLLIAGEPWYGKYDVWVPRWFDDDGKPFSERYVIAECGRCDGFCLEDEGTGWFDIGPHTDCLNNERWPLSSQGWTPRLEKAYTAARSARFEHGENGFA